MATTILVQLPVTGAVGTDDDFDLRAHLERELNLALLTEEAGECDRGEIDGGWMRIRLVQIVDPAQTLAIVKDVLARAHLLHRAVIALETCRDTDTDDVDREILWPVQPAAAVGLA
ncbi:MAG: hypothetical protein RMJ56_01535 [Gemmataceae bacterium]|nr:hypothetical protein [Gemmata sp.]MDW8196264.1 hypothetical protein [Gemmataceae bacterium]